MRELFDNYLLACFVLFSGVGLETLAWQVSAGGMGLGWTRRGWVVQCACSMCGSGEGDLQPIAAMEAIRLWHPFKLQ